MIENELREVLEAKADTFAPAPLVPERLLPRTRGRRALQVGGLALVAVAIAAGATAALHMAPDQRAFAAFTLVDELQPGSARSHTETPAEPLTRARLEQHAQCMRAHGINVPDPQETASGWTIPVNEPPFRNERAFRNAFFVGCRLEDATENLVLGGRSHADIDRLMACTAARGFTLPQPSEDSSGQFEFDLDKASPAWGSDAWYRVVFVTCAGPLPEP